MQRDDPLVRFWRRVIATIDSIQWLTNPATAPSAEQIAAGIRALAALS